MGEKYTGDFFPHLLGDLLLKTMRDVVDVKFDFIFLIGWRKNPSLIEVGSLF